MRLLFVCTGNSFRSPVAEALARRFKPELDVESAGTNPASSVAGNARELLEERDADNFLKPEPECVTQRALDEADIVVVMEQNHEDYLLDNFHIDQSKIKCWGIEDPINPDVSPEESFVEIEEKVKGL